MKGLRNVLIHEYDEIDLGEVWNVIKNDLDKLEDDLYDVLKDIAKKHAA